MDDQVRRRLKWIQMYETTRDAGLVCLRCGISRPTLRKWAKRFQTLGMDGLLDRSRRPTRSPSRKVGDALRAQVLELRTSKNIGARRIQIELRLHEETELSCTVIQRILWAAAAKPLIKPRRKENPKRYERPVPGDRVQIDTMKIAPGMYQYTAVDDCSRFRVLGIYPRRSGSCTLEFLERVIEEMPFAIERIQTDRGREFFDERVQRKMMANGIKFRPIPPRSPHLNGKVERSQLTDLQEFWSQTNPRSPDVAERIEQWQFDYNWRRPHGSLQGIPPIDRVADLADATPLRSELDERYDPKVERIQISAWRAEHAQRFAESVARQMKASTSAGESAKR